MRTLPLPIVILLALPALAGCVTDDLASSATVPPEARDLLDLGTVVAAAVPVDGGVSLRGHVFIPDVAEGERVPVVLDLGPYYGNLGQDTRVSSDEHPPNMLYEHFLRRGYAVALVSLRGTGESGGCFKIGGAEERADAAAVVEWLASQDWSNGNVAMTGVSYDGTTPWEAAVTGTPSLKAIVPVAGITDMYRYMFHDGAAYSHGPIFNTYYTAYVDWLYTGSTPEGRANFVAAQPSNVCPEVADVFAAGYEAYANGGTHGPFWDERDTSAMLDGIEAATFVVHGLQDWNVKPDHVQNVWASLPEPKRMLLGQWEHNIPWRNTYNPDWGFAAYNDTVTEWLDAFLNDDAAAREATLSAPSVLAQDSSGAWWNFSAWPPVESVGTAFHLTPRGGLSSTPPESDGRATADALATLTPIPVTGRSGVSFQSATLDERLLLVGNPTVNLTVSVARPGGHVAVVLWDVDPSGAARRIDRGFLDLAHRTSRDQAEDVPAGTPMEVRVNLYALAHVFEPGHRVRISVHAEDGWLMPEKSANAVTVHVGPDAPGFLTAPVLRGTLLERA